MKYLISLLFCVLIFLVVPALAIDLQTAKEQGLVGETPSGYLGAVVEPNAEVKELIADINTRRKAKYAEIAAKNGISLDKVEKLAGKKAIEKTPSGQYVKFEGNWLKK
jgi:uncharacterized protein YdbL (DUF1318 family)